MKSKNILFISCAVVLICLLNSCAPKNPTEHEYGFFGGIIHGFVFFPFALLAKLFGMDYGLYADNNSGFFYWLGFIIGLGGLGGGGSAARRRN